MTPLVNRPLALFACPFSLLDTSSGAAISLHTLLAALKKRGWDVVAVQASVFDSPDGARVMNQVVGQVPPKKPSGNSLIFRILREGVEHLVVRTGSTDRLRMTSAEEELFLKQFRDRISLRRPAFVVLWGNMLLERTLMAEARNAGVPVVFYLVNGGYMDIEPFVHASLIVTDSRATAELYGKRLGLDCRVIGRFVDPRAVVSPRRQPRYVTFINPGVPKGAALFMAIARLANRVRPDIRWLVVEGRHRWSDALRHLGQSADGFPNVAIAPHQTDMRPVYAATRVLLVPSLWHESGARVITEAQLNGIPVVGTNFGGTPEGVGDAGLLLDVPDELRANPSAPVAESVAKAWLEGLCGLLDNPARYDDLCRKALAKAESDHIEGSTKRFLDALVSIAPTPLAT